MKKIPVFHPNISIANVFSVAFALYKGNISGTSRNVEIFENKFSKLVGRKYGVAVSNGSVALDLAFAALDLSKDDEVILPAFTIISCLSSIIRTGAKPVFVDVDINTWNMKVEDVSLLISSRTKAVLIVHTYGLVVNAPEVEKLCREKGIILIEDAAEAHGLEINNRACGSFGEISTFSFYANKHVTTGEGGMILVNNPDLLIRLREMRNLGFLPNQRFVHNHYYWNYRLSALQASLGISQINSLVKRIKKKKVQANFYRVLLQDFTELFQLPLTEAHGTENSYWVFGIVIKKSGIRDLVMSELQRQGVETRPFFWPLNEQPVYRQNLSVDEMIKCENSELLGKNGLYLPLGSHLKKRNQRKIAELLILAVKKFSGGV